MKRRSGALSAFLFAALLAALPVPLVVPDQARAATIQAAAPAARAATVHTSSGTTYSLGPITDLSASCSGQNAEVEQAADPGLSYVYDIWMGCKGIAFARSTDGGRTFDPPISVPGSVGSNVNVWDPAVAVGPDGTVFAAFDHGATFSQVSSLIPPNAKNWGDRDFVTVGPDGTVYVTWDYGPQRTSVTYICSSGGSCAFATGDLNVVMQKSTDHGKTWSTMSHISPGFPASGGDSAPLVVEPGGRIDVLYQGYQITNTTTYTMNPAYSYFTSSADQGQTWSKPVAVGPQHGTMSLAEWWIDGDIGIDSGGNLYATWDTQGTSPDGNPNDTAWLSFSTDHGRRWSDPVQVPADTRSVPHITEVAGGAAGTAYVGWLSDSDPSGYAQYLRAFSITQGWLSPPVRISSQFGDPSVWPGDTFGISTLAPGRVVLSWGSATVGTGKKSEIFATPVTVTSAP
jgi:hypothetical protein